MTSTSTSTPPHPRRDRPDRSARRDRRPAALAKGTEVRKRHLQPGATWKLKAKTDDGRLEVELEVDSNRVGQSWSVRLKDNGVLVWSGTGRRSPPAGRSRSSAGSQPAGTDTITAYARHAASGQTCSARVVFPA